MPPRHSRPPYTNLGYAFFPATLRRMRHSQRYGRFRALLRKIREEAGLKQSDLAARLGKPQTFVSKSELGERRVDFVEALEVCAACGVAGTEFVKQLEQAVSPHESKPRKKRKRPRRMDRIGKATSGAAERRKR